MSVQSIVPITSLYSRILSRFPQYLQFSFAYGSGVKQQLNNKNHGKNMIDLIYCVDDSSKWHKLNIQRNPSHYSSLKFFGSKFVVRFQENAGAKVYYNTLVPLEGVFIKYGVITTKDLITDLLEWSDLYLAGRLHKPVEIVKSATNSELQSALQLNLQSAVHAALLTLPETFTEYDFYHTISNLSYSGDFRMMFGENKDKVENIVKPQIIKFRELYKPYIKILHDFVEFPQIDESSDTTNHKNGEGTCSQDIRPLAKLHHLNQLPRWPQIALTRYWNRGNFRQDTEDVLRAVAYDPDCNVLVRQCIDDIVWKSSIRQSLKGILTAGIWKSVRYSSRKIAKMFK
ncbi:phosphatidate cytidylyltransferase, mitochondrial [Onthophagus taurus]|uniref:phosphatidate cytidylyltransferase, mitochondrial n=1 Tax=Onthophagus taurus TaxID=166361 RepID=UPI000C201DF8|nr:phosphatidate cytidylyltransferase, mitochondrial [Onthophagus taurus]